MWAAAMEVSALQAAVAEFLDPGFFCAWSPMDVPSRGNVSLCLMPQGEGMSDAIRDGGASKLVTELTRLWREGAGPPGIFVDVGANLGVSTAALAAEGAEVIALEAQAAVAAHLRRTLRANGFTQVLLLHAAVADTSGETVDVRANADDATHSGKVSVGGGGGESVRLGTAQTATLDGLLWPPGTEDPPDIKLLKIDVEGSEVAVLRGATRLLTAKRVRSIHFELNPPELAKYNFTPADVFNVLHNHSYVVLSRNVDGEPEELPDEILARLARSKDADFARRANIRSSAWGTGERISRWPHPRFCGFPCHG